MNIEEIIDEIKNDSEKITDIKELEELRVKYLGKKGIITELQQGIKNIDANMRREYGIKVNEARTTFTTIYEAKKSEYEQIALNKKLESEAIDISLPATQVKNGSPSIVETVIEDAEEFFISMGYDIVEGPEIELDKYNFEMLNLPKEHPARDAQDTFYLKDDTLLLRSQTSPVQIREMLSKEGREPIRMICPGKTYRRENTDMTHEQEFAQIEGLVIDRNISLSDLKGTFNAFVKHVFGEEVEARFRPSYYPFTEPSVEMDMSCPNCHGDGCSMCKPKGWITICGGGMVHPNVLRGCGYDPNEWQGFAFGAAAERIAMLKYGINDIRTFHQNDLRETKNFDRKETN